MSQYEDTTRLFSATRDGDVKYEDGEAHGWIQWKGTNVCMDVRCSCGKTGHVDAEFCYHVRCGYCGKVFAVGQNIMLIPLSSDLATLAESAGCGIKTATTFKEES